MSSATENRLVVAIVAAGASRRLGKPKQLIELRGEPLLRRQCRIALEAGVGPVSVILGYRASECAATIVDLPVAHRVNENWEEGLASSVREAAQAAVAAAANGLLLFHVDQYRLEPADLVNLNAAWQSSHCLNACISAHDSASGPPVIFPKHSFGDLLLLKGDTGARSVLAKLPACEVSRVSVPNAFHDLDLPSELAKLHEVYGFPAI
jgi:CTP:molybdopterin cytidylyltransferase MocA